MFVLLWLQLAAAQEINHYHVGTYETDKECQTALKEASVLVTGKNESIACLYVGVN
jgi:hypothetical protein|tara:strand:- start:130 stop:297 length:168 start_codon:yes stop_codon:yes gene_type:complete